MPTDWKNMETIERLVAAIIASNGGKVDNQAVARYFNDTYDAIENRTRVYKKAAQVLVKEAEEAGRLDQDMRKKNSSGGKKTAAATPKKVSTATSPGSVKSGRVIKRAPKTPSRLKRTVVSNDDGDDDDDEDEIMTGAARDDDEV